MYGFNWKEAAVEPRYRVGDRVRVLTYRYVPTVANGSYGVVHELVQERGVTVVIDGGDGFDWYFALNEIEPAPAAKSKYKVGQRVRFTDAVSDSWWFKAGETGVISGDTAFGDYVVRVDRTGPGGDRDAFVGNEHLEPAFLPGDKVRVTRCNGYFVTGDTGTVERQSKYAVFVKHGPYQRVGLPIEPEKLELVEAADEKPGPKFKIGDSIRIVNDGWSSGNGSWHCAKVGDTDTVVGFDNHNGRDRVEGNLWFYHYDEIEIAPDCPKDNKSNVGTLTIKLECDTSDFDEKFGAVMGQTRPHIVALVKNGQPRPADRPYVHANLASATTEAERLARNNPGQEFAVYQRVAGRVAEVSYEMKEVA